VFADLTRVAADARDLRSVVDAVDDDLLSQNAPRLRRPPKSTRPLCAEHLTYRPKVNVR
jgi:hypothetical protein